MENLPNKYTQLEERYNELERLLADPEAMQDKPAYNRYAKELSDLSEKVSLIRQIHKAINDIEELNRVLKEKHDQEFLEMAKKEVLDLGARRSELENKLNALLRGKDTDLGKNIIVEIRAGTGGLEASNFASDLYRMYTKYAAKKNWTVEVLDSHMTELGGVKEIVFSVSGKEAYKRLKFESGVHRIQRVPETEAQGRIHTSTASVVAYVEPEEVELQIDSKDIKIDVFRSSGAGGQSVNTTDSAVRITHLPSGLVVSCQDERSQLKNKNKGMRVLRARLLDKMQQEESQKVASQRKTQIGSGDRSEKIRTYNFPDRRVTDHRIGVTLHRLEAILEGDLDELSDALIKAEEEKKRDG